MKLSKMLALAAVTVFAVACGDDPKTPVTTTTDTTTSDASGTDATTGSDAAAPDTAKTETTGDTSTDVTAGTDATTGTDTTNTTADTSATDAKSSFPGCTAAGDQGFLQSLAADKAKGDKFRDDVKSCTLTKGCLGKATDNDKVKCINDCLDAIYVGTPSSTCDACYALNGYCGASKCLSKCAVDAASAGCQECLATNCDPAKNACAAGSCDPYGPEKCVPAK